MLTFIDVSVNIGTVAVSINDITDWDVPHYQIQCTRSMLFEAGSSLTYTVALDTISGLPMYEATAIAPYVDANRISSILDEAEIVMPQNTLVSTCGFRTVRSDIASNVNVRTMDLLPLSNIDSSGHHLAVLMLRRASAIIARGRSGDTNIPAPDAFQQDPSVASVHSSLVHAFSSFANSLSFASVVMTSIKEAGETLEVANGSHELDLLSEWIPSFSIKMNLNLRLDYIRHGVVHGLFVMDVPFKFSVS